MVLLDMFKRLQIIKKQNCRKLISVFKTAKQIEAIPQHILFMDDYNEMNKELQNVLLDLRYKMILKRSWNAKLESDAKDCVDPILFKSFNEVKNCVGFQLY